MKRRGAAARVPGRRCAIYTRKSTEEGLEQDFNSLDAQRAACEAFIASQRSEGWTLFPTRYDDGGISGGTLERPALQRLLGDMRGGAIDIVVVYKVDRLTRSLADFAKLVETLDAAGASFVSVTQQFNTSTSMGRLTLNMLLSFAQFEREVTAERIRDKIAASRARGLWMGGPVPLGYDAVEKTLVVNAAEAETVRHIVARYRALGSVRHLATELERDGIRSKRRVSRAGREGGGRPFTRGALITILRNPVYIGEVRHKGQRHPGQHEPILDRASWEAVQAKLADGAIRRRSGSTGTVSSPLAGLLFDGEQRPLTPSHASKRGVRYRYYIANALLTGLARDHPDAWRLPAKPVEDAVRTALSRLLRSSVIDAAIRRADEAAAGVKARLERSRQMADEIAAADGSALRDALLPLEATITLLPNALTLSVSGSALAAMIGLPEDRLADCVEETIPLAIRKRGQEARLILGEVDRHDPDPKLVALLDRAETAIATLIAGEAPSVRALARTLGADHRLLARTLPLAFLAPDIKAAIREGRQPAELTPSGLRALDPLPLSWPDQRAALGFAHPA